MSAALHLTSLPVERWSLHLDLARPLQVTHPGSMLRGAFGHALKTLACKCHSEHHAGCVYQQIFEPAAPIDWPARFNNCPPAYVLSVPTEFGPRQSIHFGFTLLGPCLHHRGLLWRAWQVAAAGGFGPQQITPHLHPGDEQQLQEPLSGCQQLQIRLLSPLLLKHKSRGTLKSRPLAPEELTLRNLLVALHRRLELTQRLYGVPSQLPELAVWLKEADALDLRADLQEQHFARHSNRQQQSMPLYGLSGVIHLSGPLSSSLRSALAIGQWLHIGGKTALGFGGYRLHSSIESSVHDRRSAK